MVTYTERYGKLWKLFIKDTMKSRNQLWRKEVEELDKEFEKWLFQLNESLGIAG